MMKYVFQRIIAIALSACMFLPLTACGGSEKTAATQSAFGLVWSAPSTVKIGQDDTEYANKGNAELAFKAVRNEYESGQLLITADKEIESFTLETADLQCGDQVLSKDNVVVYTQKYVSFSDYYGENLTLPDALLPMESAALYQENAIQKGKNGALWITVYVPKELGAGLYKGTFQLVLKGSGKEEILDIPVSVDVYDYTLTDAVNADTLFSWRYDRVAAGELDESIEMMTAYYEFFKDYRISLQSMPLEGLTGEEFAECVLRYYDQVSTYSLLKEIGDISIGIMAQRSRLIEQILSVAEVCPDDKNLLEKATIYPADEPDLRIWSVRESILDVLNDLRNVFDECVLAIQEDNTGKYDTFKTKEGWEESIRNIRIVIPTALQSLTWLLQNQNTPEGAELLEAYDCLCPYFTDLTNGRREAVIAMCEKFGIHLWWYGCTDPKAPAPTYHIGDTNLFSARAASWLQYAYDVEGTLYWDAAAYTDEDSTVYNQYINVYETPFHSLYRTWPAGDGFLAYPGAAYGVYGPLPSIRLMSIRDGLEEYELLKAAEEKLENCVETFGEGFSAQQAMNGFYNPLCSDISRINADESKGFSFDAVRTNLLNTLVALDSGLGIAISGTEYKDGLFTLIYYAQADATVSVDGQVQQSVSGQRYQYSFDYREKPVIQLTVTNAEGKNMVYTFCAQAPLEVLNSFSENESVQLIEVSEGSQAAFAVDSDNTLGTVDGTAIELHINGVFTGDILTDAVFHPYVLIDLKNLTGIKLAELEALYVNVILPGDSIDASISLCSGDSTHGLGTYNIPAGASTLMFDLSEWDAQQLEEIDGLLIEFANLSGEEAASYELYIDSVSGQHIYAEGE